MEENQKPLGIMNINELEKEIEKSLKDLEETLFKADPLIVLTQLYTHNFFDYLGDIEKSVYGHQQPHINKLIDFTQNLIVTSYTNISEKKSFDENDMTSYIEELKKLFTAANVYINIVPKDDLIKYSQGMQMNVSGTLYPFFEKEHFTDMLFPYTDLLYEVFGLTSDHLVEGLIAISTHLRTTGFIDALIDSGFAFEEELSEEVLIDVVDYFNVESLTGWPTEFIQELSLQQGALKDFYKKKSQVMLKESAIKYKPFINIKGIYYCFSIDNLLDNFYRSVLRALRTKDGSTSNRINDIQKDLSEALPFKFFKSILPTSQMFQSVFYKAPVGADGKNEWCECDGIILIDNVMIIIEVKGGALSPVSPFSDEEAYKNSLNSLARNPYEQALRFFKEYKKEEKIEIFKKEGKKSYKSIASIENIKFIQACCITLDDFNEIASQIEKTEFIQNSDLPVWCVSINDLRVYPELFDSPSLFLNYLYQRSHVSKNNLIKLNDELDHIGMYFAYNDYSTTINEMIDQENIDLDINNVYIDSHREEIDAYMARKANNIFLEDAKDNYHERFVGNSEKPKQNMGIMFEKLIKSIDSTGDDLNIRVARYLLLLDIESKNNLDKFLSLKSWQILAYKSRSEILTPGITFNYKEENKINELPAMQIFLLFSTNKLFKDASRRKRFLMERVFIKNESTYCMLVGMNKNKEFKKVITHIIEPEAFQSLSKTDYKILNDTREKIINSRNIKEF